MAAYTLLPTLHRHPPPYLLPLLPSAASFQKQCRRRRDLSGKDRIRSSLMQRRSFFLAGVSCFALNPIKSEAFEVSVSAMQNMPRMTNASLRGEDVCGEAGNQLITLLKGINFIGLRTLGAFYVLSRLEIEGLKTTISSGQASLPSELTFAKIVMKKLHLELQDENVLAQELLIRINQTDINLELSKAGKMATEATVGKNNDTVEVLLHKLNTYRPNITQKEMILGGDKPAISRKEIERDNLFSTLGNIEEELAKSIAKNKGLKLDVLKKKESEEVQKAILDDLNEKLKSTFAERDESISKLQLLEEDFIAFKSIYEEKTKEHLKIQSEKDLDFAHLQEKLDFTLNDGKAARLQPSDLDNEKDNLSLLLDNEFENVKCLNDELQVINATLAELRLQIPGLLPKVEQSKITCEALSSGVLRNTSTSIEKDIILETCLNGAKMNIEMLSYELSTTRESANEARKELHLMSNDLRIAKENNENLKAELLIAQKKAETSAEDLAAEKMVVSHLNNEMEVLREQLIISTDARRRLKLDLDEVTELLKEMNSSLSELISESEAINCRTVRLEAENKRLHKFLVDQKDALNDAVNKLDDAQNLISKLANVKVILVRRGHKLDEELALAKGEILMLKRTISSIDSATKGQQSNKSYTCRRRSSQRNKRESTSDVLEKNEIV